MSKYRFFAYDPETGFEIFKTAEQAQEHAEECINEYRGEAGDVERILGLGDKTCTQTN